MKYCNNNNDGSNDEKISSLQEDFTEYDDIAISDLLVVYSPHHTTSPGRTSNSKNHHGNDTSTTKIIKKDNNNDDIYDDDDNMATVGGLEKLLFGKLTDDQGLILKQLLLSKEKEYQHHLQEKEHQLQLILKEKNHELMIERKDHEMAMEKKNAMIERKDHDMTLMLEKKNAMMERKDHEIAMEKKNAEIEKQQLELENFKLRFLLENNAATTTKGNITDRPATLTEKMEEIQELIKGLVSPTINLTNSINDIKTKMDENDNAMTKTLTDLSMALNTIIEETQERVEGLIAPTNSLVNQIEQMNTKIDENSNTLNENLTSCTALIETNETKLKREMHLLKQMFLPKPLYFHNDRDSIKTFSASSWPVMKFGKHKWTIKFTTHNSSGIFIGLAGLITVSKSVSQNIGTDGHLGHKVAGWGYFQNGSLLHDDKQRKEELPGYSCGDSLTFVLDLGVDEQNTSNNSDCNNNSNIGSLYVSVNGKEQHLLVSNLSAIARSEGGFIPVVSLCRSGDQVCFVYDYECILEE